MSPSNWRITKTKGLYQLTDHRKVFNLQKIDSIQDLADNNEDSVKKKCNPADMAYMTQLAPADQLESSTKILTAKDLGGKTILIIVGE